MSDVGGHPPASTDDTLKTQREKFDQYRQWMKKQQETLDTTGAATAEMARRMDDGGGRHPKSANDMVAQESAYARRHKRAGSPAGGSNSPNGGGQHNTHSARNVQAAAAANKGGSPPSPYNRQGQVIYSSPPGAERPQWMNTKVGSTNQKSQIPPEQLAKFVPPPPPSDDGSGYMNDPLNVYSRSQLWSRRKHQKMSEAREIKEQVMDMECTFTPQTHAREFLTSQGRERGMSTNSGREQSREAGVSVARSAASHADSSKYGGGAFHVTGVEDFLARQQKAREEQEFKDGRLKTKPQYHWRNETTVTEPFELGRKRQAHIKSLKQPFTAAPGAVQQAMRQVYAVPANNVFQPLEGILPRGVFSGVTAAEIVDSAVLRTGAQQSQSPAMSRH